MSPIYAEFILNSGIQLMYKEILCQIQMQLVHFSHKDTNGTTLTYKTCYNLIEVILCKIIRILILEGI